MEIKNKAHWFFHITDFDVNEMFQDRLIMVLNHISKQFNIFEDS